MVASPCVRETAPETPSRCHEHCGTVPTEEPVEFEPSMAALAELKLEIEIVSPSTAIGATIIATNFFNIGNPFLGSTCRQRHYVCGA